MVSVSSGSVQVTLTVRGDMTFYGLVHSDGTINRFGSVNENLTGPAPGTDTPPTIGMTQEPYFQTLLDALTPELVGLNGHHANPASGSECRLEVLVTVGDRGFSIDYEYGAGTQKLPPVLREFVFRVVKVTDDWLRSLPPRPQ